MSETVRKWYEILPPKARDSHPDLFILMGRCEIHRGEYAAAGTLLDQARQSFLAEGNTEGEGDTLTSLITLSYESNDRMSTAKLVERAMQLPLKPNGQVAARLAGHGCSCMTVTGKPLVKIFVMRSPFLIRPATAGQILSVLLI